MPEMTITEALAELKVIDKRIRAKCEFIGQYAMRLEALKDPLEREGGSVSAIQRELQAIGDLEENQVSIRRAIQKVNETTQVTVGKTTRSIADWLVWRRDIAPRRKDFTAQIRTGIDRHRAEALKRGAQATGPDAAKPGDLVVNLNEQDLARQQEELEATLETLDGQLSLKNATVVASW